MAWETRGGHQYYYRKKRVGTKVVSEYVGSGLFGQFIELEDLERREQRQAECRLIQELKAEEKQLAEEYRENHAQAVLAAKEAGICRRKGEWRSTPKISRS
jgi:hypothetical protein